jgi:hypothetical protein
VHYSLAVQRLFRTSKYYIAVNPKRSVHSVLLSIRSYTIHRVQCTIYQRMSSGPPRTSTLKDKSVYPVQKSNFTKMPL